jgi:hypothetical protein
LFFSFILEGIFAYLLYRFWDVLDVPTKIPASWQNRLGSGFLSGTVAFLGYGMLESWRELQDKYNTKEIHSGRCVRLLYLSFVASQLFVMYLRFVVFSVFGSTIWNGILWIPSLLIDLYLIHLLPGGLATPLNIFLSLLLMYLVGKAGSAMKLRGDRQARLAQQQKPYDLEEQDPLLQ